MKQTNRDWLTENKLFKKACEIAGILPTGRQASKYRRQKGLAFKYISRAQSAVDKKQSQKKEPSARI